MPIAQPILPTRSSVSHNPGNKEVLAVIDRKRRECISGYVYTWMPVCWEIIQNRWSILVRQHGLYNHEFEDLLSDEHLEHCRRLWSLEAEFRYRDPDEFIELLLDLWMESGAEFVECYEQRSEDQWDWVMFLFAEDADGVNQAALEKLRGMMEGHCHPS